MNNTWKSIGACVVGVVVTMILSLGTDKILEIKGILPIGNFWVSNTIVLIVIFYRTVYNVLGAYVIARLAPQNKMLHALIVGAIGTFFSIVGAIINMKMNLGPDWYCWAIVVLALPSTWLGAKIYLRTNQSII